SAPGERTFTMTERAQAGDCSGRSPRICIAIHTFAFSSINGTCGLAGLLYEIAPGAGGSLRARTFAVGTLYVEMRLVLGSSPHNRSWPKSTPQTLPYP